MVQSVEMLETDFAALIERGRLKNRQRDWDTAGRIWQTLRQRFPDMAEGYVGGGIAAREAGQPDVAESLLGTAVERFPADATAAMEHAALAARRRDWVAAAARWQLACARFPDHLAGYTGLALALREQARHDAADAVLADAQARFPAQAEPVIERGLQAQARGNWSDAIGHWAEVRARAPGNQLGWINGALALRTLREFDAAEALLREAIARFPEERRPVVEHAWLASARRDWQEATRRWAAVRERFPATLAGYVRGAAAHAELWQYQEAEAVLRDGMARFPDDAQLAIDYAQTAVRERRLEDAYARYEALRAQFPQLPEGHLGAALALRSQFKLRESEALLEQAQDLLPNEPRFALEHAFIPVFHPLRKHRDNAETLRRLAAMRARFPDFEDGFLRSIQFMRQEALLEQAEAIAQDAVGRMPQGAAIAVEFGIIARERGDMPAAIERLAEANRRFPQLPGGYIALGTTLSLCGREAEGEAVLLEAMRRFPTSAAAYTAYGEIAMRRQDWPEASRRWGEAHRRFPDDKSFAQRLHDVRLRVADDGGQAADEGPATAHVSTDPRLELHDLVMNFESLGGQGLGCEFGMFQREFGAEPLGLLRWASMPYDGIIQVLEERFAGVGAEEYTEVFVNRENTRPEYCSRDHRGFMFMRAFVNEDDMPMERMRRQVLRRLVFLKDKLISDLQEGRKIFVWRSAVHTLTDAELRRLHAAVRSYGPSTLFYVRYQDAAHPNGTVEVAAPGLLVGYIDRFKMAPDGTLSSVPASASWTALCRAAFALWRECEAMAPPLAAE